MLFSVLLSKQLYFVNIQEYIYCKIFFIASAIFLYARVLAQKRVGNFSLSPRAAADTVSLPPREGMAGESAD